MSAGLTRCRVSSEQLHLLLSFMEEHRDFAVGKQTIYSRFSACKLWRLLAERLNGAADESGGAHKSPDKWCRFWADLKYKARKKSAAGGALGELSGVDERVQNIFGARASDSSSVGGRRRGSHSDEERKPALDEDMYSEESGAGGVDAARLGTEELLAEAAMRSALAAEKQAEAVTQAVELLRDLVSLLRERPPAPPPPPPPPPHPLPPHASHAPHAPTHAPPPDHALAMQHHHHRL